MALTGNKLVDRQPGDLVTLSGASGQVYYTGAMLARNAAGKVVPMAQGVTLQSFLGVANNYVNGTTGGLIEIWKTGIFTFNSQGTGASAHIGQIAYAIDDYTVGVSAAKPRNAVGEIVDVPTSTTYRVRISTRVGDLSEDA